MTTRDDALPNMPPSISFSSCSASRSVGRISTPFPAQRPSAFNTYGALRVLRNRRPSSRCSPSNVSYAAVGISWRRMNALAKSFEPSSTAPAFDGPMTGISLVRSSAAKSSYMPFTRGSSGPTTTIETCFSTANDFIASKSSALMATLTLLPLMPSVPALPGAIYRVSHFSLCAIFHARACSRPPEPKSNIFISIMD